MYTVLSIVPIIAMLFGIAKGFGLEKMLQQQLVAQIPAQDTMMLRLMAFAENMLANAEGGIVAGMGVMILFWTVIKVIGMIEESFNQIWQIKQGRSLTRKLSDYLSLMLLAPILLIVSSSITVFVSTQLTWIIQHLNIDPTSSSILLYTLNYLPIIIMAILFSFTFMFMPNQKVQWQAGVIAGIVTGIIYQLAQWAYLTLQVGVSSYNAIYGSFAALPLFFIWLQLGWVIVLFGCEISFYIQNYASYKHHEHYSCISFSTKKIVALQVTQLIVSRFSQAEKALSCVQIAEQLNLPQAIVQLVLTALLEANIVVEIKSITDDAVLFQPAQDTDLINVYMIIEALENQGNNLLKNNPALASFVKINADLQNALKAAAKDALLKESSERM
jgi:membrane protein